MQHSGFLVFAFISCIVVSLKCYRGNPGCIISDLERSVDGSIEIVTWGQKYIKLNLERSGEGSNKWKLILWCRGRGE